MKPLISNSRNPPECLEEEWAKEVVEAEAVDLNRVLQTCKEMMQAMKCLFPKKHLPLV